MARKKGKCCKDKNLFKCFLFLFFNFYCCQQIVWSNQSQSREFYQYEYIPPVFMTLCAKPELFITYSQSQHIKTDKAIHMTHLRRSSYQWKLTLLKKSFQCSRTRHKSCIPSEKKLDKKLLCLQKRIKLAGNCSEHSPSFW